MESKYDRGAQHTMVDSGEGVAALYGTGSQVIEGKGGLLESRENGSISSVDGTDSSKMLSVHLPNLR